MPGLKKPYEQMRLEAGRRLASCDNPGDETVITGISGRFPGSANTKELMDNLAKMVDLCTFQSHITHPEIPKTGGRVSGVSLFDNGYFGIHTLECQWVDPMIRLLLECSYEAIVDAGLNPDDLKGTKTGVFVGTCESEYEMTFYKSFLNPGSNALVGCTRSMVPQRISYCFQLNGPAVACDSACSSGMYAFDEAYRAMKEGRCDSALVCGCNLTLEPMLTLQFARVGVLNDGISAPFDERASGYTRSEAIVAVLLQKRREAKRIYATVVHSKSNDDGFKENGITFPSSAAQLSLIRNVFEEANLNTKDVGFVEAHGTGTVAGYPEEVKALDTFFKPTVEEPLLIGSIKSNIGHTEPAAGLCSIVKTVFAIYFENILPNINFLKPRKDIDALVTKRIKVISENTPFASDKTLAAVNSFGFGGASAHAVFRKFSKNKLLKSSERRPLMICYSARNQKALKEYQQHFEKEHDVEFLRLVQEVYRKPNENHLCRGFTIFSDTIKHFSQICSFRKRNLGLVIGNYSDYSDSTVESFINLPIIMQTYREIQKTAQNNGIFLSIYKNENSNVSPKIVFACVLQIATVQLMKNLELNVNFIQGIKAGRLTEFYFKNKLTLDELTLCIYHIFNAVNTNNNSKILLKKLTNNLSEECALQVFTSIFADENEKLKGTEPIRISNCTVLGIDCLETDLKHVQLYKKSHFLELVNPNLEVEDVFVTIGRLYLEGFQPQV